ncbi:hypothetical protein E2C01_011515 [Portunus trituberculatus]|uniref:Uncharacterized protein n=1 Tax=Portunus trituberculatus TaxID=210409 RepID=A0A5B7DBN2_PORTR|nr:hypothetical protein [Portunus trituberculatus]
MPYQRDTLNGVTICTAHHHATTPPGRHALNKAEMRRRGSRVREGRPLTSFTFHNGVFYLPVSHKWVINYPLRLGVPSACGDRWSGQAKASTSRAAALPASLPPCLFGGQSDDLKNSGNFGHLPELNSTTPRLCGQLRDEHPGKARLRLRPATSHAATGVTGTPQGATPPPLPPRNETA